MVEEEPSSDIIEEEEDWQMPCIDLSLDQDFAQWLDSAVNGGEMSQEEEGPLQDPTPCPTVLEEEVTLQDQCPLGGSAEELAEWIEKMWEAVGGDQTMEPAKSIPPVEAAYPAIDPNFFTGSPPPKRGLLARGNVLSTSASV